MAANWGAATQVVKQGLIKLLTGLIAAALIFLFLWFVSKPMIENAIRNIGDRAKPGVEQKR